MAERKETEVLAKPDVALEMTLRISPYRMLPVRPWCAQLSTRFTRKHSPSSGGRFAGEVLTQC